MPDTGAPHALPYPAQTDPPNGPAQMQALAERLDTLLDSYDSQMAAQGLVFFGRTGSLQTDANGNLDVAHGAPFTPTVVVVTPMRAGQHNLVVTLDGTVPISSLHFFVNVWDADTGAPYQGAIILHYICRRALP